jgi:methyl-accepting chemotaxis protein
MNFSSIRVKLIASFFVIGFSLFLFMVIVVPDRTRHTSESVMLENAEFVVNLLADNLAIGMQAREFDDGASLQQTLDLLKGDVISSVAVLDENHSFVKGINSSKANCSKDTVINLATVVRIFRTMKDGAGAVQGYVEIEFSKKSFLRRISRFGIFIWLAGIVALAATVIVGGFLSNSITAPLNRSIIILNELASGKGDLTKRLRMESDDEVGKQAKCINMFMGNLQSMVAEIKQNAENLKSATESLGTTSAETSGLATHMKKNADTSFHFVQDVKHSLETVRDASSTTTTAISSIATSMEQLNMSIKQVAGSCQKEFELTQSANDKAMSAKQKIEALESMARAIGSVVELIQSIADKTNLLALNASIQAASAGSAGRGFAVVANEIKELARQTGHATSEINTQVEGIQQTVLASVGEINTIASLINEINTVSKTIVYAVDEQSGATNEMSQHVNTTNTHAHGMQTACNSSADAIAQINTNIGDVNTSASKTLDGVRENGANIESLMRAVEKLNGLVNRFTI